MTQAAVLTLVQMLTLWLPDWETEETQAPFLNESS